MKTNFVIISDEHSKLFGHRILNSQLSLYLGLIQLFICIWAFSQHIWAMFNLNQILFCDFSDNSTLPPLLTRVDAIIYDIGLFHHLWGITGCVAQHLDGGYGRFCWCITHIFALIICLPFAFCSRPRPYWLWPLLIQQSAYGVGMLILSLAAFPKAAQLIGDLQNAPIRPIAFYIFGTLMNFFLLYVYWHWYWHVESLWNSARKLKRGETLNKNNKNNRRPFRRASPVGENNNITNLYFNNLKQQINNNKNNENLNNKDEQKKQLSVTLLNNNNNNSKIITTNKLLPIEEPSLKNNNNSHLINNNSINIRKNEKNNKSFDSDISLPSTASTTSTTAQLLISELSGSSQKPHLKKYYSSLSSLPPISYSSNIFNNKKIIKEEEEDNNYNNIHLPLRVLHLRKQEQRFGHLKAKNSLEENRRSFPNELIENKISKNNNYQNSSLKKLSLQNGQILLKMKIPSEKNNFNKLNEGQQQINNNKRIQQQLPINNYNQINYNNNKITSLLTSRCSLPLIEPQNQFNKYNNKNNKFNNNIKNNYFNSLECSTNLNNYNNDNNKELLENSVWNFRQNENLEDFCGGEETWQRLQNN